MSTLPPPPPPPPVSSGPPRPPVRTTGFPYSIPVAYAPLRATSGLRKAVLILMWCAVGAGVAGAVAGFSRRSIVDGFFNGDDSLDDVRDADQLVGSLALLEVAVSIAVVIVLAVWSYRTVSNGVARGAQARPGLAAGGWFIPIGWYWVGFGQLRKAMTRSSSAALGWWQAAFIVAHLVSRGVARMDNDVSPNPFQTLEAAQQDMLGDLSGQNVGMVIAVVLLAIAAGLATKALPEVDADTTRA